jgi:hypothetical protein
VKIARRAGSRRPGPILLAALALATATALGATAAPASAAPVSTVLQDDALFLHGSDAEIADGLERLRALGIDRLRLTAGWSVIAPQPDAASAPGLDATDPATYPAGHWANLDRAVRMATAAGVRPMIDIAFWAPRWATTEQADVPERLRTGIDAHRFAAFATAVARRYNGSWRAPSAPAAPAAAGKDAAQDPFGRLLGRPEPAPPRPAEPPRPEPLPAVDTFTIWNEPNHPGFLLPQWKQEDGRWIPASADAYRAMVYAAYPAIKAAAPASRVLVGGTSSLGSDEPPNAGVPPLKFLRRLACVDETLAPITTGGCADFRPIPGDGWSHHPYSLRWRPDRVPRDSDEIPVGALGNLSVTLRELVRLGRLAPELADLYLTEYGYETNLPDPQARFSQAEQAGLLAWAEDLATRVPGVRMWPQFLLRDRPGGQAGPTNRPFGDWQSGLITAEGVAKPAYATFRTPVHASCEEIAGRPWTRVWARLRQPPAGAAATIEVGTRPAGWRAVASSARATRTAARAAQLRVDAPAGTVVRYLPGRAPASIRVSWSLPDGQALPGLDVAPTGCPTPSPSRRTT